jgi:hypothetical protein
VTNSKSEGFAGLLAILVLSVVLVGGLLFLHLSSSDSDVWTTTAPQQPAAPDNGAPVPAPASDPASPPDTVLT